MKPPYILVGHSYGAPLVHAFATSHPTEVAGVVYVDPTDVTQTIEDSRRLWTQAGDSNGARTLDGILERIIASAPPAFQAEWREATRVERSG